MRNKVLWVAVAVLALMFTATAGAAVARVTRSALPAKTAGDVNSLAARAAALESQASAFSKLGTSANVVPWETRLKSDESALTSAEAKVNADLSAAKATSSSSSSAVGSTLTFKDENNNPYRVALLQIIDPAQGSDQFETPDAGKRFVATVFRVSDAGNNQISDDANSTATVIGSDDQSYTADFDSVSGCTNFNDGEYQLSAGESVTGCVVFQVPSSVTVSKVEWSPDVFGGKFGQWNG